MRKSIPFLMDMSEVLYKWRSETFWEKEPETLRWLEDNSANDLPYSVLVDVGANIGMYSMYWLSQDPNNRVFAYEPSIQNFNVLSKNMHANNFESRANLNCSCVTNSSDKGYFTEVDTSPGSSGGFFSLGNSNDVLIPFTSNCTAESIANLVSNRFILKIDVDGQDFEILRGFQKSLEAHQIISVLIEIGVTELETLTKYLLGFGYIEETRYLSASKHSDNRRILAGKSERNRVFKCV